jgi:hypothetical protein
MNELDFQILGAFLITLVAVLFCGIRMGQILERRRKS